MKWLRSMITFAENSSKPETLPAYRFASEVGWMPAESPSALEFPATELQLITWNINAQGERLEERFLRAMQHLRKKVFDNITPPPPFCILLQEVHEDVLPLLLRHRWIREHCLVTPISTETWATPYGIVTLVSKAVPVSTVFMIDLPKSAVGRRALFVDLHLSGPPPESPSGDDKTTTNPRIRVIRICNTHLEPEPSGARARPTQLEHIARMLNVPNLDACICAGSMSSVRAVDKTAPSKAGFADAYKGLKENGMTWGFQPRSQVSPGRLDKVLYFPTEKVEIGCPIQIGYRVTAKGGDYVSDHCGLSTMVKVLRDN